MYPSYNYYPPRQQQQMQPQQPQQQIPPFLKGRPVSSLEEVRAIPIDFDGSIFYFPDIANRRIYTKQINLDGTALINMYEFKPIPVAQETTSNANTDSFITREEFDETMSKIKEMFAAIPAQSPQPAQKEVTKKPAEMPKF
jgi:hypothetical protein